MAPGTLVRARGREWVVLPESAGDLLVLRPLGGSDEEVTGIYLPLEPVEPARFSLPSPAHVGDHRSCRLLRDALRLGFRSSAGPFRSFGRIDVEPRPYQLVPLLMALRLDPVRLLIADDVGVGKTIEACLVARELLDRGEIRRLVVLCPPPLAEQWQAELARFHVEAELVLPSTATRLERACALNESLFERHPFTIVSTDFVKADRRRGDFLRTCPELVIVDEAHGCVAAAPQGRTARHQRYELLRGLAAARDRHLLLVTATPHSGKDDEFRALLGLLDPDFAALPDDLAGPEREPLRRQLARHLVQRRRADIEHYLQTDTPFPRRAPDIERGYGLTPEYRRLFDRVLAYARETVADPADGSRHRQRIRWWSALALLRALASSPEAAAATLRERARVAETAGAEEADEVGARDVLDLEGPEGTEQGDLAPGGEIGEHAGDPERHRRRLRELAREAGALAGAGDAKLQLVTELVRDLQARGHQPIVFCRFIPTAEYVARHLGERLEGTTVAAVTGLLPPADREQRVADLARAPRRVLVCTDCLSEGVNLQEPFDAVVH
ncbi:MAG TPA: DEAD/DEAH box helicase, partial [Methylomirabilota bacterium]|nr:DEAD/DEAH box helicase [Methylomirabilota bacterium]